MDFLNFEIKPKYVPALDDNFRPASLVSRTFRDAVERSCGKTHIAIALERGDGLVSTYNARVFADGSGMDEMNFFYVERIVKSLLWMRGGWKVTIGGSKSIGEYIRKAYAAGGVREFDAKFMSKVYEKPFTVEVTDYDEAPEAKEAAKPVGRHLEGCRIGFDAGGSDRKVSAVINGEVVYSEEVIWHPKTRSDPDYHYNEILKAVKTAAAHMPRVDAIGVSSAGIFINNRVRIASLFMKVPENLFDQKVKDIYLNIAREMGDVPIEVANDGDVTALAGAIDLQDNNVLGIAMGTSEAGGYVDKSGNITGWLNELAFVPVDFSPEAAVDEWSGDYGCGVKYLSQDAVIRLAPAAGIVLDEKLTPAEKLKVVQELNEKGDSRAVQIFKTIGCYLGYAIAYYAEFYDIRHVLILGRVTSGKGGGTILDAASEILKEEFPELSRKIELHLPDEPGRRVGQSIAAASLPEIR